MSTTPTDTGPRADQDLQATLAKAGEHWGLFLAFGVLSVLLGAAMMIWPKATVAVVAILLGAWLLVSGVFSLVTSFAATGDDTAARVLNGIAGALSIVLGVLCFRGIFQAVEILALFVGIGWLLRGVFETMAGIQAKGRPGRGWTIAIGLLSIVAGIVVLGWPAPSLLVLAWISGIWLVVLGIFEIIAAFGLRSAAKASTHG